MLASNLSHDEMRKEVRRLIKTLRGRISRIESLESTASQFAARKFRELEKTFPKNFNTLSDKELTSLYRDLRYINNLKSSTVKGALNKSEKFDPIVQELNYLSKEKRDSFWQTYNKLLEISPIFMNYKYEIFDTVLEAVYVGYNDDDLVDIINSLYQESLEQLGEKATYAKTKLLFTSKLRSLFS